METNYYLNFIKVIAITEVFEESNPLRPAERRYWVHIINSNHGEFSAV